MLDTRGEAVLAFVSDDGFLQPQTLLEAMQTIYFDSRKQLEFMQVDTTCTCQACVNMASLA